MHQHWPIGGRDGRHTMDPVDLALSWASGGEPVVLATVVETWGSAPVPAGSCMVVGHQGDFAGSVSGGCIESEIIENATTIIDEGQHRIMSFGIADDIAWRAGLPCGGRMRVLLERYGPGPGGGVDVLAARVAARSGRRPLVVSTDLSTGRRVMADDGNATGGAAECLARGQSRVSSADGVETFHLAVLPPPRAVIVGAVEIARILVPMLSMAGIEPIVIDPRPAFATAERFPAVELDISWPAPAIGRIGLDDRTALVTLTHADDIDDEALRAALPTACRYIGALGSTRNHQRRVARLKAAGFSAADIARIHGPAGLDIGAVTPAEIALSIAAELVAAMRGRLPRAAGRAAEAPA